jgi:hypothetical protein
MALQVDSARDLLLGLCAFREGLIDQAQLLAAFDEWVADGSRSLGRS